MSTTLVANGKEIFTDRGTPLILKSRALWLVLLVLPTLVFAQGPTPHSIYTSVAENKCRTLKSSTAEAGDYLGRCAGTAGYTLLLSEGDLRQNLTVVTPHKKEYSLDLWSIVSSGFSSVRSTVEWRILNSTPVALILRYDASEDPEKPDKKTSYLVVTKITTNEICVTDKISPGSKANEEARRLAEAASKPCLKNHQ
jgi:hypothetical protein